MPRDTDYLIRTAKAMNLTPEQYRKSKERIEILTSMINDGEQAKRIKELADAVVKDTGDEVLAKLLEPNSNTDLLRGYSRGAVLFRNKMNALIQLGEKKRQTLDEIKKSQKVIFFRIFHLMINH